MTLSGSVLVVVIDAVEVIFSCGKKVHKVKVLVLLSLSFVSNLIGWR